MHPCDAKGIFFSEVEVLRVAQSKRSSDVELHVALDCDCADPCVGPAAIGGFVSTECSLVLLHVYKVCFLVF